MVVWLKISKRQQDINTNLHSMLCNMKDMCMCVHVHTHIEVIIDLQVYNIGVLLKIHLIQLSLLLLFCTLIVTNHFLALQSAAEGPGSAD